MSENGQVDCEFQHDLLIIWKTNFLSLGWREKLLVLFYDITLKIALAMETTNAILIVDDLKGRQLASKMSLNFMGTLGLLVTVKEHGVISAVRPYIEKIQTTTDFGLSSSLVDLVLERTGEKQSLMQSRRQKAMR
ncbi:DUF3368 domain-containing protein [Olivibacter sitiensis]|uniref:DUF3368 domain-containing protein n=1 Tax=Olivibacter sitiensis TaxID=376470 RepID=UPI0012F9069F|nr:DUF3368 domain-containing protein [Olivibacter sitiensis]